MSTEPLNTAPIQQFISQVKSADASRAKEIKMPIDQAKRLAFSLGEAMARLNGDLEKIIAENKNNSNETIEVRLDGGGGWN
jgi:hypothetical protein